MRRAAPTTNTSTGTPAGATGSNSTGSTSTVNNSTGPALGSTGRRLASLAATGAVLTGLAGLVSAPVIGLLTAPTGIIRWFALALLVVWVAAAVALALTLAQQRGAPRRQWWLPLRVQHRVEALVELSAFGVGGLRGWTRVNPGVGLDRVYRPSADVTRRLRLPTGESGRPGGAAGGTGIDDGDPRAARRLRRSSPGPVTGGLAAVPGTVAAALDRQLSGPMTQHQIERGETWWSLAERHLGDGRRWTALRDLNLGVEAAPGVLIDQDSVLRPGWRINVPATPPPLAGAANAGGTSTGSGRAEARN